MIAESIAAPAFPVALWKRSSLLDDQDCIAHAGRQRIERQNV